MGPNCLMVLKSIHYFYWIIYLLTKIIPSQNVTNNPSTNWLTKYRCSIFTIRCFIHPKQYSYGIPGIQTWQVIINTHIDLVPGAAHNPKWCFVCVYCHYNYTSFIFPAQICIHHFQNWVPTCFFLSLYFRWALSMFALVVLAASVAAVSIHSLVFSYLIAVGLILLKF